MIVEMREINEKVETNQLMEKLSQIENNFSVR